jgi:hypothetical protein
VLELLDFGVFSLYAEAAKFPEYKCMGKKNSTVFKIHTHCLQIMLPVLLIKITWGQRNLVSERVKEKPDLVT